MWFRLKPLSIRDTRWHKRKPCSVPSWYMAVCCHVYDGLLGFSAGFCETRKKDPPVEDQCKRCRKQMAKKDSGAGVGK